MRDSGVGEEEEEEGADGNGEGPHRGSLYKPGLLFPCVPLRVRSSCVCVGVPPRFCRYNDKFAEILCQVSCLHYLVRPWRSFSRA